MKTLELRSVFDSRRGERLDFVVGTSRQPVGGRCEIALIVGPGQARRGAESSRPDAGLLVSLLPTLVHVRGIERLSTLMRLVGEDANEQRSGRDLVLSRLVEVLLVQALRTTQTDDAPAGLLRGLSDARPALAIREIHSDPARSWTVAQLAKAAALSRSAFFDRFVRAVGMPPMEYLLAWRMAIAKDLLRHHHEVRLDEVAERVGYRSASTFSTAFSRHVGQPPGRYARANRFGANLRRQGRSLRVRFEGGATNRLNFRQ